jgi:hypothetical protein
MGQFSSLFARAASIRLAAETSEFRRQAAVNSFSIHSFEYFMLYATFFTPSFRHTRFDNLNQLNRLALARNTCIETEAPRDTIPNGEISDTTTVCLTNGG